MPPENFRQLTRDEFAQVLEKFPFSRRIDAVHMHHTWSPDHADYRGRETIVGMWRYHTQTNGWSDIAQHVSIAPDGSIWTGRNWNKSPASATGYNGSSAVGPFMFETIGNFDSGHDRLDGSQLDSVVAVIALVQKKFGLPAESLRFHRQMTDQKSCPGTGVRRDEILAKVKAYQPAVAESRRDVGSDAPFSPSMSSDTGLADGVVNELLDRGRGRAVAEESAELAEDRSVRGAGSRAPDDERVDPRAGVRALFTAEELARLAPHVVNLNQGELSTGGSFQTTKADVDAIFTEHIPRFAHAAGVGRSSGEPPLRIVFFAHGGLVSEAGGLAVARKHIDWWKANQVYPIYFVWETGLAETLGQLLSRAAAQTGVPAAGRGLGDVITDRITDPLIARICHTIGGVQIWGAMKFAAQRASEPNRGGSYVAEQLEKFLASPDGGIDAGRVELHAVGHSAGTGFHAHFVPMAADIARRSFRTVQFLAPAVRIDTFKETLWPRIAPAAEPAAESLAIFTMKDALERDDNCGPYRKSLLYLIHDGLEPAIGEPILGLERSLRGDAELAAELVNPATRRKGEVIWSTADGLTTSRKHGDFDDDAPTMNSVGRRVLGLSATQPLAQDFSTATEKDETWFTTARELRFSVGITPAAPAVWSAAAPSEASPHFDLDAPIVDRTSQNGANGGGARRALCIGIDKYPTAPLSGCVADARLWFETLRGRGFSTKLLLDADATREGILSGVQELVRQSKAGDVLVLQYSGHGTEVPDETGDEQDDKDQALCPFDFAKGALLVDDDVAKLFAELPAGMTLTCFFDCCHSGSITRFAVGDSSTAGAGIDRRVRFVKATPELIALHRTYRRDRGLSAPSGPRAFTAARGPVGMREVVFSACRRDEVALESDGQGEFTRRAVPLLAQAQPQMSNKEFQQRVVQAFGSRPAQHPILDCAPEVEGRALFGVVHAANANRALVDVGPDGLRTVALRSEAAEEAARLLRGVADLIRG